MSGCSNVTSFPFDARSIIFPQPKVHVLLEKRMQSLAYENVYYYLADITTCFMNSVEDLRMSFVETCVVNNYTVLRYYLTLRALKQ